MCPLEGARGVWVLSHSALAPILPAIVVLLFNDVDVGKVESIEPTKKCDLSSFSSAVWPVSGRLWPGV